MQKNLIDSINSVPSIEKNESQNAVTVQDRKTAIIPMSDYAATFAAHCMEERPRISSGFESFDIALNGGFSSDLYIMAAETSTGKSAIMMTLAQNMAAAGIDVLYFALEMSRDEFVARGISALSYQAYREDCTPSKTSVFPCFTAGDVLYNRYDPVGRKFTKVPFHQYRPYADQYFSLYGDHLHIIESGMHGWIAKDIANTVFLWKKEHPASTVAVFVDYLQNIRADPEERSQQDRKTKTDVCVNTLKTLASQLSIPVITISSVSRSSYKGKIGTESFKESGDTEYTAGILLGWNWLGVTDERDQSRISSEKAACSERGFRRMELDILKYRNSARDQSVLLNYYPQYNFFVEADADLWAAALAQSQSAQKF